MYRPFWTECQKLYWYQTEPDADEPKTESIAVDRLDSSWRSYIVWTELNDTISINFILLCAAATSSHNDPWYRKPTALSEEQQEGKTVKRGRRSGWYQLGTVFSMVGSLLCIQVWTGCTKDVEDEARHNKLDKQAFHFPVSTFCNSLFSSWPKCSLMDAESIFLSLKSPLCWLFVPELISDWGAQQLIDSWLQGMAFYLFSSWPLTFSAILLIYLDVSSVNIHKSAVLESRAFLARGEQ